MNVSGKVVSRKCIYLCALVETHSAAKRSSQFSWHGKAIRCTEHAGRFKALQSVKRSRGRPHVVLVFQSHAVFL